MALIRFSNLVNDIRGSTGGNTFARNKSGAYVRNRTTPLNPGTSAQSVARADLAALSQGWRQLGPDQRDAWNAAAENYPYQNKLGEERFYSGEQLFITLNRNMQSAGQPLLESPAAPAGTIAVVSATMTANNGTALTIDSATLSGDSDTNFQVVVMASAPLSAGIFRPSRSKFKNIQVVSSTEIASADLVQAYSAVYGTDTIDDNVGSKLFLRMYVVNITTGERSPALQISTVIVSL